MHRGQKKRETVVAWINHEDLCQRKQRWVWTWRMTKMPADGSSS